jgi:RNA polymerase primary sigma factor
VAEGAAGVALIAGATVAAPVLGLGAAGTAAVVAAVELTGMTLVANRVVSAAENLYQSTSSTTGAMDVLLHRDKHTQEEITQARVQIREKDGAAVAEAGAAGITAAGAAGGKLAKQAFGTVVDIGSKVVTELKQATEATLDLLGQPAYATGRGNYSGALISHEIPKTSTSTVVVQANTSGTEGGIHRQPVANGGGKPELAPDNIQRYFRDIEAIPTLSNRQTLQLGRQIAQGGPEAEAARQKLIKGNLRLPVALARRYKSFVENNESMDFSDLIQAGNIGLMRAAELWNPEYGVNFREYAKNHILKHILRAFDNDGPSVRIPVHKVAELRKRDRGIGTLHGRMPDDVELASITRTTAKAVAKDREVLRRRIPIEEVLDEGEGENLLPDVFIETSTPEDAALRQALRRDINRALLSLTPREERVLRLRFGLYDDQDFTLGIVGKGFGVGLERIRQIEAEALRKLKHPSTGRRLRQLLDD